jgi:tetratricopeptide (TPR) repeat protein
MTIRYDASKRQVVPRCLTYATACSLGLLTLNRRPERVPRAAVKDSDAMQEWTQDPSIAAAVDLVAEALILKDFQSGEAMKAAEYILSKAPPSKMLIRQLAGHFLEQPLSLWVDSSPISKVSEAIEDIGKLKKSVRAYLNNSIAWSDLALSYATLGQMEKAKMATRVAMALAGHNRFILRNASRCFMHVGEPDQALSILNKSGLCASDPWIASAEIAISDSAGLKSKCISKARDLLENDNLTPFSKSELAVSIGTIEVKSGSLRRGKKLVHQALIDPTENALAQAEWVSTGLNVGFDSVIDLEGTVPASYEAIAVHEYFDKAFASSLEACRKWGRYQFLSPVPIILSTFISACILNDDAGAIYIFENALPAQKKSCSAINNYAFSLAKIGRTADAARELDKVNMTGATARETFVLTATMGLICFRSGYFEEGRKLYADAVGGFESLEDYPSAAMATYHWAVEEKRIGSQNAESKIREAKKRIERHKVFEFEDLAKKL